MFTGIITDVGQVRHIEKRGDTHFVIATQYDVSAIDVGASIACSGACMTVVDKGNAKDRWFAFTASGETLSKTTLGDWKVGDPVNLERPMRVGDELGGHIVSGHVDDVAEIVSVLPDGESTRMIFQAPVPLALRLPRRRVAHRQRSRRHAFRRQHHPAHVRGDDVRPRQAWQEGQSRSRSLRPLRRAAGKGLRDVPRPSFLDRGAD
jgi:hypothetical protein